MMTPELQNLNKVPMMFFTEQEKGSPKIHLEAQMALNSQSNYRQEEQFWRYHNKLYYRVTKPACLKNRHIDQRTRTEDLIT